MGRKADELRAALRLGLTERLAGAGWREVPSTGGLSCSDMSFSTCRIASTRKPSTPRAIQNRSTGKSGTGIALAPPPVRESEISG